MEPHIGLFVGAGVMLVPAVVFGLLSFCISSGEARNRERLSGTADGRVEEVIRGWTKGVGGKMTDRFPVYSYFVGQHRYVVKPYVMKEDCELNRTYRDGEGCTCTSYLGPHGGLRQTKYAPGERLRIQYDPSCPQTHRIVNDRDKAGAAKAFRFAFAACLAVAALLAAVSLGLWLTG